MRRVRDLEQCREYNRRVYATNPEKFKALSAHYRLLYPDRVKRASAKYLAENRDQIIARSKVRHIQLRLEMIVAYGSRCSLCGESHQEFLCIDHTNGGGRVDRENGYHGLSLYAKLRREGWPRNGYRLLCYNCNMRIMLEARMSVPQKPAQVKYTRKVKQEMVDAYGGRCECCGESDSVLLALDHIHGDGQVDRKNNRRGRVMYVYLRRLGWPRDDYRLLCHNCNMARGFSGRCPHKAETLDGKESA